MNFKLIWIWIFQVEEVQEQISHRKAEVEKLIKEMRDANMESLAISPPEESKQFLDGENYIKMQDLAAVFTFSCSDND